MADENIVTAFFEVTGLKVPLPEGWHFHDEGASRISLFADPDKPQTIDGRVIQIFLNHRIRYLMQSGISHDEALTVAQEETHPYVLREMRNPLSQLGRCIAFPNINYGSGPETHLHILYTDQERDELNVALRAHEEFHAISKIPGAIQNLEQHFLSSHRVSVNFGKIHNEEVAAWCNAVFALHAHSMDPQQVYPASQFGDDRFRRYFGRAMEIYDRALNYKNPSQGFGEKLARLVGYN
ncbi:hypothetical protein HYX06_06200 [Candidatus Woesearchaeota archaeon]|nr:hypothetical protein [Candidatus Woesearchaeota archaeon]